MYRRLERKRLEAVVRGGEGSECAGLDGGRVEHRAGRHVVHADGGRMIGDTAARLQGGAVAGLLAGADKTGSRGRGDQTPAAATRLVLSAAADPPSPTVEEGEGDHQGDEEGEKAVDDVDGKIGGARPGGGKLAGVDTSEGGGLAPGAVLPACDARVLLGGRL